MITKLHRQNSYTTSVIRVSSKGGGGGGGGGGQGKLSPSPLNFRAAKA